MKTFFKESLNCDYDKGQIKVEENLQNTKFGRREAMY